MNSPKCRTVLIEDVPAEQDAFSTKETLGPHARVAIAIGDLVEQEEAGGKVIGLEGIWGAGKSTVVNFLRKKFDKRSDLAVTFFDAWAHQGDPLRRTFLETFVRQFQELGWLDREAWNSELDRLANRRKDQTTTTIPQPTSLGAWIAFATLFIPFGVALMNAGARRGLATSLDLSLSVNWLFAAGSVLVLSPVVVLIVNFLIHGFARFRRGEGFSTNWLDWRFLSTQMVTEHRTQVTESANPTSIEFEQLFTKAMTDALTTNSQRRVLIVLDNLDRVDAEDALEIWSTLQTFLQDRRYQASDWFRRVWILVPYDAEGLRKLWDKGTGGGTGTTSESFFDKSFQVRFYVPPPVLSDWKGLLLALLRSALPDHNEQERYRAYQVYERFRVNPGRPPTPRELKVFVNQVGAIHRQWVDEFPLPDVAYFVIQSRHRSDLVDRLTRSEIPESDAVQFLGDELRSNMAGLAFNTRAEKGLELLLAGPIEAALKDGKPDALVQLESKHGRGFWVVLEKTTLTCFDSNTPVAFARACSCLAGSGLMQSDKAVEVAEVIRGLRIAALRLQTLAPLETADFDGIAACLRLVNDAWFTGQLVGKIAATLDKSDPSAKQSDIDKPLTIAANMVRALRQIVGAKHDQHLPQVITLPLNASQWTTFCRDHVPTKADREVVKFLQPRASASEICGPLCDSVNGGGFSTEGFQVVQVTNLSPVVANWSDLTNSIRNRLDAGANAGCHEVVILMKTLWHLASVGRQEANAVLKQLAEGGHLLHYLHKAEAENNPECAAACILGFMTEFPKCEKPSAVGNSEAGFKSLNRKYLAAAEGTVVTRFMEYMKDCGGSETLFTLVEARSPISVFLKACLRHWADDANAVALPQADFVIKRMAEFKEILDDEPGSTRFARTITKFVEVSDEVISRMQADGPFDCGRADLYLALLNIDAVWRIDSFVNWCLKGVNEAARGSWESDLQGRFSLARLAIFLVEKGRLPHLSIAFTDALVEHAKSVATGNHIPPPELIPRWPLLVDLIDGESILDDLGIRLVDIAVECEGEVAPAFFDLYERQVSDLEKLRSHNRVTTRLFSGLLRCRNRRGLEWLDSLIGADRRFLDRFRPVDNVEAFEQRLLDLVQTSNGDEVDPILQSIAKRLGIDTDRQANDGV